MKTWILEVQKFEDGEQYLEFPQEVMDEAGWKPGDVLKWTDRGDGSWSLTKIDENHENTDDNETSK